jgi:outer membrane protein assembly factor BamB
MKQIHFQRIGYCLTWIWCFSVSLTGNTAAASHERAENWPQWRGEAGLGISPDKTFPTEWSESKNVLWKTPVEGRGHSSPIIWGKKIFLTTAIEGPILSEAKPPKHVVNKEQFSHPDWVGLNRSYTLKVLCLDRDNGKLLWQRTAYEGGVFDYRHRRGSYASPTPVTDGSHVYAFFGSEGLYCYTLDGKLIWKASLGGIRTLGMGVAASPVLHKNLIILQCDENEGDNSFIAALDKDSGKEVWRRPRRIQVSWSTPLLVKAASRDELVTTGNEFIISYDPTTGQEFWRCKGLESNAIHTPVAGSGMVIVSAGYPAKRVIAIRLGGSGDLTRTSHIVWQYNKGTAYVASPILFQDFVYLLSDKGILTCLDVKTGDVKYDDGRVPIPATFMSSPVAFDSKILLTSDDGHTFVVKAGTRHEVLASNSVGEPVYASLALADGKIFIRGEKTLYCVGDS